ncbi:protein AE7-like 2 [Arabidopsis lyrata subsp. lyrata]|uniref:protein AE7-like 2 n=1 Tax=Arabidopsis lyrata subsp. lyrata TaxID=81972 RepID=UPI000A29B822|nr:protein AE7-like 2 [Arabidopsis lyrata subsp. lyrata]|eukprot:XP_020887313.1 protein AE7-like 2 [Arabidopsis lyrata subsp. lyrata]
MRSGEKKMDSVLINENPIIYPKRPRRVRTDQSNTDEFSVDPIDQLEIFDRIRDIRDPEHPKLSLEDLNILTEESVEVDDDKSYVRITFTPTLPHCHLPTPIGLCLLAKLAQSLPARFKVDVRVAPGSHDKEKTVNKQLGDKERVAAGLENPDLVALLNKMMQV